MKQTIYYNQFLFYTLLQEIKNNNHTMMMA